MEALEQVTMALALLLKIFTLYFICIAVFTLRRRRPAPPCIAQDTVCRGGGRPE